MAGQSKSRTAEPDVVEDDAAPSAARALSRLFHHRWALPILARVAEQRGAKFVSLGRQLGVRPERLKRALLRLSELDLVVRNPGYGHPMRPEYVLGGLGQAVAASARALWHWTARREFERELLKKWQLPALLAVSGNRRRFKDIQRALPEATPRALTLALKALDGLGLIRRRVDAGYPPTPTYGTTRAASAALRHLQAIGAPLAEALFSEPS